MGNVNAQKEGKKILKDVHLLFFSGQNLSKKIKNYKTTGNISSFCEKNAKIFHHHHLFFHPLPFPNFCWHNIPTNDYTYANTYTYRLRGRDGDGTGMGMGMAKRHCSISAGWKSHRLAPVVAIMRTTERNTQHHPLSVCFFSALLPPSAPCSLFPVVCCCSAYALTPPSCPLTLPSSPFPSPLPLSSALPHPLLKSKLLPDQALFHYTERWGKKAKESRTE